MSEQLERFLRDFGKKVKEIREVKKYTLEDLEFSTGIDSSDFNKIELGKTNITLRTFIKVAKGLEVHPKELLDFKFDLDKE
ncbi:helix-turn-helix domain-containing protein [Flavobacterium sp. 102]|uniref:helix-turn-helix domain-containing protein n=1 Tax=Flavobacterium sp. 102 TaxID=2135623 RepID=UPI000EB4F50D|nr:helix-turn-helix transcriptional regulator [Flavobacterium sp. 102]RKS03056.1 DNA-binding Xre family transcriptional regulator [Flavobacterium sp. 102]